MKKREQKRLPAELTLVEAAEILGRHRSNVYRRFKPRLRLGTHSKRKVWLVPMKAVLEVLAKEKNDGVALPEIDDIRFTVAALQKVMERYATWAAKVAHKLGMPV